MFSQVSASGYAPEKINFCPECGAEYFPYTIYSDGRMKCAGCGLICYIVEADDSHREEDNDE